MAEFAEQSFHLRSNSMPSTSHPTTQRVEEELNKLRTLLPSSFRTAQLMCDGLRGIGYLYELIEELLRLPSRQPPHPSQRKWVEAQLDETLKMLDLIGAVRDCMVVLREHGQDLRSALRGKGKAVTVSNKKAQKLMKDCRRSLKRMASKSATCPVADVETGLLVKVLVEARESTSSLLQYILSFLSKPKQKGFRWSIISKANHRSRVACEGKWEKATEEENAEFWLQASYEFLACKDVDALLLLKAQNHLETLESKLKSLDSGLDCLFRRLIQNRVSMLNLLSL